MWARCRRFAYRCWAFLAFARAERELQRETEAHLGLIEEDLIAHGVPPVTARQRARRVMGGLALAQERQRDVRSFPALETLRRELRHCLKALAQRPAATVVAATIIALTVAASTLVFSIVDRVLLRPLSIDQPDQVVVIWPRERVRPTTRGEMSYVAFRAWQRELEGIEQLVAMGSTNWSLVLREGDPVTIPVAAVSGTFFALLRTPARLGRLLTVGDDQRGAERVAVLSYGAWQQRFGGDPHIVNRAVRFDSAIYTVVGVAPEGFDYPPGAELWVPLTPELIAASADFGADLTAEPGIGMLSVLGRLDSGVTPSVIEQRATALMGRMPDAFRPEAEAEVTPLDQHIFGRLRPALYALVACTALLLGMVVASVSTMLVILAQSRAHEYAMRRALGAPLWALTRGALIETLLLTCAGVLLGIVVAAWAAHVITAFVLPPSVGVAGVRIDARSVCCALAVGFIVASSLGLIVGSYISSWDRSEVISHRGARLAGIRGTTQRPLVAAQVALACVLLTMTGLVGRSFANVVKIDLGFRPDQVLSFDLTVPGASPSRHNALYEGLIRHLRATDGVQAVGAIYQRPLEHDGIGQDTPILIEGDSVDLRDHAWDRHPLVNLETVTPGYVHAIGLTLVAGRFFTETDTESSARVAVVSQELARQLWPGADPVGKTLLPPGGGDAEGRPRWATVVGVVRDARYRGLTDLRSDLYLPHQQMPGLLVKHVMVRTAADPLALVGGIRAEVRRLDGTAVVERFQLMEELVDGAIAPWRLTSWALTLFSGLALCLAAFGVYATTRQIVAGRTREIAVRTALGARRGEIAALVVREEILLPVAGVALGTIVSLGLGGVVRGLLYGVTSSDPPTLLAAGVVLVVTAIVAVLLPAWRGAHVDPGRLLREQ